MLEQLAFRWGHSKQSTVAYETAHSSVRECAAYCLGENPMTDHVLPEDLVL